MQSLFGEESALLDESALYLPESKKPGSLVRLPGMKFW